MDQQVRTTERIAGAWYEMMAKMAKLSSMFIKKHGKIKGDLK